MDRARIGLGPSLAWVDPGVQGNFISPFRLAVNRSLNLDMVNMSVPMFIPPLTSLILSVSADWAHGNLEIKQVLRQGKHQVSRND